MKKILIIESQPNYNFEKLQKIIKKDKLKFHIYYDSPHEKVAEIIQEEEPEIFSDYGKVCADDARNNELLEWDQDDQAEELNNDGEWWV